MILAGDRSMGSIEPIRDDNGRTIGHRARWRDPDGRQRKKQFRLKREAEKHVTEMESSKARGAYIDLNDRTTVAQAVRRRIDSMNYRENTATNRESQLTTHIEGTRLGGMRLVQVRRSDIQAWVTELSKELGPASTRLILGLVRTVFRVAAEDRVIGHNPAFGRFFIPAAEMEPIVPLEVEQVRQLADAVPPRKKAAVIVQAATGVRAGELLGWQVPEVDFLRRTIVVREQLHRCKRIRVPLKTAYSRRDLPLPQIAIDALAEHLAKFPANDDGFIFTDEQNRPWQYASYNDSVVASAKKLGLPHTTTHDLRHHYASVLLDAGESVVTVAARLGHKDAQLVLTTYGHLLPSSEDRTRKAVDAAWHSRVFPRSASGESVKTLP
jgi:integrase